MSLNELKLTSNSVDVRDTIIIHLKKEETRIFVKKYEKAKSSQETIFSRELKDPGHTEIYVFMPRKWFLDYSSCSQIHLCGSQILPIRFLPMAKA